MTWTPRSDEVVAAGKTYNQGLPPSFQRNILVIAPMTSISSKNIKISYNAMGLSAAVTPMP
jgi:hypothetical protein